MHGYYQKPTIFKDAVVFICEDDLWWTETRGGVAQRLTSHPGRVGQPAFSPDGQTIAFGGRDEGHSEVCLLRYEEGSSERLTFLGADTQVVTFSPDGLSIFFMTNHAQAFGRNYTLGSVPVAGGPSQLYPWGPASSVAFQPGGPGRVLARYALDPARWKRYRGGTVGRLWVDRDGQGNFSSLIDTTGNVTRPLWLGERIYFGSDHEGWCNLYSCTPEGGDLRRHTHHQDFYLRWPSSDGTNIVYQCGADLYLLEPGTRRKPGKPRKLDIRLRGSRGERLRKFPTSSHHLESYDLHPRGHSLAVTVRGKGLYFPHWEQSVRQVGHEAHRYRLLQWLHDGERLIVVSDASGEECLELLTPGEPLKTFDWDFGRALSLVASPKHDKVLITNHRHQILLGNLEDGSLQVLDESPHRRVTGPCWSSDGNWIAYCCPTSRLTSQIRLVEVATLAITNVTEGLFQDFAPTFDPAGRYLFFLSSRTFDPVWDHFSFELSFPKATKPYLVLLREDVTNPFVSEPKAPGDEAKAKKTRAPEPEATTEPPSEDEKKTESKLLIIDIAGLTQRILEFPVPEGRYHQIKALADQVLWTLFPVEGTLGEARDASLPLSNGSLQTFEWKTLEKKELFNKVGGFCLSLDSNALAYRSGYKLRVVSPTKKPENNDDHVGRKSGWINLQRVRVSVTPLTEWKQMAREAWRLMRDHFWDHAMSGVEWEAAYRRFEPLLDRLGCRSEFSDWLWELQAELGTSHAYEYGGDYRSEPNFAMGKLAADLEWDDQEEAYRITAMVEGDCWDNESTSPLLRPGAGLKKGDVLLAINGQQLQKNRPYQEHLVHCAGQEVQLTVRSPEGPRFVHVKALRYETPARYRQWVKHNRARAFEQSGGRVGYIHVPNMGPLGFAEFHRGYFSEVQRAALIVDVRYNGGGNVSQLLLEKLARRIIGWDVPRHGEPHPYPLEAPLGPIVALTNEAAGSDGDIFSHSFKLLKLGPLVGTRTWGGVIGIWPRHRLVDGTTTTQPEFATWMEDVGWKLENYGTDPDFTVEIRPQDWHAGRDPQLEKSIELALEALERVPPRPNFSDRPNLTAPQLPP